MSQTFTDQVVELLETKECHREAAGTGLHDVWYSGLNLQRFTCPKTVKSRRTANHVLAAAGLQALI